VLSVAKFYFMRLYQAFSAGKVYNEVSQRSVDSATSEFTPLFEQFPIQRSIANDANFTRRQV
ncbi:MAG TPA: hypothetical protein VF905_07525, partial [Nitrospirota bacterium]